MPRSPEPIANPTIALRNAIIEQESNGHFWIVNSDSGALGIGQVMPENLKAWSEEALGYSISKEEFLKNPQLQTQIIDYKLAQYWQRALRDSGGKPEESVRRVASQWYSGDPNLYESTTPQFYNGQVYPSVANYTLAVLEKYRSQ
ncbi:transglycosylase SLT domain-containing protein [Leptolyngbya sp. FACHB-261]|uniref:transglycosylase SLT domain-containing protein n=1 Tax=Leptolyngbya sp. FACHB-261 TaxID=2692806 RepID=UPI001683710F|nr:transglycosylase SLT domain-containing protein [Leptolyngbya sp. FACHB-261]MBD2100475.1 hypothetical protein [Leptolyngbya sp. FACHB-261]